MAALVNSRIVRLGAVSPRTQAATLIETLKPQASASAGVAAGTITWNSSGNVTSGSGVALTSNGLVGAQAGVSTITITAAGAVTTSGTVAGGAITSSSYVDVSGCVVASGATSASGAILGIAMTGTIVGYSNTAQASYYDCAGIFYNSSVSSTGAGHVGVAGSVHSSDTKTTSIGTFGYAPQGMGVFGLASGATGIGVLGSSSNAAGYGVYAGNTAGGTALYCAGTSSFAGDIDATGYKIKATLQGGAQWLTGMNGGFGGTPDYGYGLYMYYDAGATKVRVYVNGTLWNSLAYAP